MQGKVLKGDMEKVLTLQEGEVGECFCLGEILDAEVAVGWGDLEAGVVLIYFLGGQCWMPGCDGHGE